MLTVEELADLLSATAATIEAEVQALPPALARWHPAPGEWCINEILGHIVEAERRGFYGRIRQILAADNPQLASWDKVEVARGRADCARDPADILAEFLGLRRASVELVRGLTSADLSRGGEHPVVGHLRIADVLHEWVHHDRNHVRQMLANVQSAVWPYMANAQKFAAK